MAGDGVYILWPLVFQDDQIKKEDVVELCLMFAYIRKAIPNGTCSKAGSAYI